ncbi:MAG: MTAP family purine nucleoside phosphorylase [Pseudomonadota bacterium]|nr:MTAP family purine nucleoside phosphorylase [Pseudomonadota bacterium]
MLAIIGGTGLYDLAGMETLERIDDDTPFGPPSGPVLRGRVGASPVLFLARHGAGHRLLPHEVNYRANIFALKRAGATLVLGVSAVGSLAEQIAPGDLAMPEQYVDWTRGGRAGTFFGGGVAAHVSTANPVSAALVGAASASAQALGITLYRGLTYACVEGPRLGTRAESHVLRQMGCHLVGMTNVPEAFLAREAQMAYATVGIVTDYDCWMDDPARHVSVGKIFELYGKSLVKARALLDHLLAQAPIAPEPAIRSALAGALLTSEDAITPAQRTWLDVLRR